ncbi:MAG: addiction module protein [Bryobacteraceae bacterium]|jgi:putative addiction module component (TIGR02574 family)
MERDAADVLRDALALSPEVSASLIDSSIGSLDPAVDAAAEEAWAEEIHRRLQQIDSGVVTLVPWDEARRRLRSGLGEAAGGVEIIPVAHGRRCPGVLAGPG